MTTFPAEYEHAGQRLVGQMALPPGADRAPAVLVMHEGRGIGGASLERINRLSALGYVAFACDMFGDGRRYAPADAGEPLNALLNDSAKLRDRAMAAVDMLKARPEVDASRVAAIGFCFGGKCVLELARAGADLRLFISYHGILTTDQPAATGAVKGKVVAFCGDDDPFAPICHIDAWRDEMIAVQAQWQLVLFGGTRHSFTDPEAGAMADVPGVEYSPSADRQSWSTTLALLEEHIGPPSQLPA